MWILVCSFGVCVCVCTDWVSGLFWGGTAGHFHVCVVRGRGSGSGGADVVGGPPERPQGRVLEIGMFPPEAWPHCGQMGWLAPSPSARTSLPTLGGVWDWTPKSPCGPGIGPVLGSHTRFGKNQ